jgi:hypothetical protein
MKFEKGCYNCRDYCDRNSSERCSRCDCDYNFNLWKPPYWLERWLNSFDTNSATKCFEAVNLLKQRLEDEDD